MVLAHQCIALQFFKSAKNVIFSGCNPIFSRKPKVMENQIRVERSKCLQKNLEQFYLQNQYRAVLQLSLIIVIIVSKHMGYACFVVLYLPRVVLEYHGTSA